MSASMPALPIQTSVDCCLFQVSEDSEETNACCQLVLSAAEHDKNLLEYFARSQE